MKQSLPYIIGIILDLLTLAMVAKMLQLGSYQDNLSQVLYATLNPSALIQD